MINPVEEFLQINIYYDLPTRGHITLGGKNRVLRTASGTEAVAVFTEGGIEQRLQDLQQRLLDQSVGNRRDTQLAFTAVGFGNHHSPYRTGPVDA